MVTLDVEWTPGTDTKHRTDPPQCRLNYLTTPGVVPGGLPGSIMLRPVTFEDGYTEYRGSKTLQAPSFHPLRVRIELRPPYGTPHAHIAYIIPISSARVSTALVVLSILAVALVGVRTLTTLLLTPMQTAAGLGATALGLLALFILRSALSTLRSDDLPLMGITYLIHRSLGACALVFAGLIGVIQQCVVVIDNQTDDDVEFKFSWRDEPDVIAAHSQISVVPPNREQLLEGLLGTLAKGDRDRALCVEGAGRANHACSPDGDGLIEDWRLHPFTPTLLALRCGRRWGMGLRSFNVLPDGHQGIRIVNEEVWLKPKPGSRCGRDEHATLWYWDGDRNAAHYVSYPWSPQAIEELGKLWISVVDDASEREINLALRSVVQSDDPHEFQPETRIRLSGSEGMERAWPLRSLSKGAKPKTRMEVGESLPKLTDPFVVASMFECGRAQERGTGLQAVRIGYEGPTGWLTGLEVLAGRGLSWNSTWQLHGGSSRNVAVPWICSAFTGTDPRLSPKESFSSDIIKVHLSTPAATDQLQLVLPARLMSRRIDIYGRSDRASGEPKHLGIAECSIDADPDDLIVIGRVTIVGGHQRVGPAFHIQSLDTYKRGSHKLGSWTPMPVNEDGSKVWLCWPHDSATPNAEVNLLSTKSGGTRKATTAAQWIVGSAEIHLDAPDETICYVDENNELNGRDRLSPRGTIKAGYKRVDKSTHHDLTTHRPEMGSCKRIYKMTKMTR